MSRSLAACEGAVLLVDAAQGIEAQTLANLYLAMENDLTVIPVLNKIDLPGVRIAEVLEEVEESLALDATDAIQASAKQGIGIEEILTAIVTRVPPPAGERGERTQALVFDAIYDDYRGIILYARIKSGRLRRGDKIRLIRSAKTYEVSDIGRPVSYTHLDVYKRQWPFTARRACGSATVTTRS